MNDTLQLLHFLAGLIVLAEALNKLERCSIFKKDLSFRARCVEGMKMLSWFPLAFGAGGAVSGPFMMLAGIKTDPTSLLLRIDNPTIAEVSVLIGFATMIIRTRIKEG